MDSKNITSHIMLCKNMIENSTLTSLEKHWLNENLTEDGRKKLAFWSAPEVLKYISELSDSLDKKVNTHIEQIKKDFFASIASGNIKVFSELAQNYPCSAIPSNEVYDACINSQHPDILKHFGNYYTKL